MLTLHYAPNSIAVVTAIALHEAGLTFETVQVDFAKAEQTKPAYQAINPKGRVPALVTPAGILTETGALLEYIADTTGKMRPSDPIAAAKMRELMYYLAGTAHVNHAHKLRGSRWASQQASLDDMRAMVPTTMAQVATYLEDTLAFAPFALGQEITLADPYLFVILGWLASDGVDIELTPKLATYHAMMSARPAVLRVRDAGILV